MKIIDTHEFLDDEGEIYTAAFDGVYFAGNNIPVAARPIAAEILRLADLADRRDADRRDALQLAGLRERERDAIAERVRELKKSLDFSKTQVTDLAAWKDRLAEENTALKAVIERRGDIRRVQPVLDAALTERDRLAEENRASLEVQARQAIELERMSAIVAELRKALDMSDRIAASLIPGAVVTVKKKLAAEREENRALKERADTADGALAMARNRVEVLAQHGDWQADRIAALEAELASTEGALRAEIVEHSEMLADRLREVTRLTAEVERLKAISGLALEDAARAREWCQRLPVDEKSSNAITSINRALYHLEGIDRDLLDGDVDAHPQPPAPE